MGFRNVAKWQRKVARPEWKDVFCMFLSPLKWHILIFLYTFSCKKGYNRRLISWKKKITWRRKHFFSPHIGAKTSVDGEMFGRKTGVHVRSGADFYAGWQAVVLQKREARCNLMLHIFWHVVGRRAGKWLEAMSQSGVFLPKGIKKSKAGRVRLRYLPSGRPTDGNERFSW